MFHMRTFKRSNYGNQNPPNEPIKYTVHHNSITEEESIKTMKKPSADNQNPSNDYEPLRYSVHDNFITEEECNEMINLAKKSGLKIAKIKGHNNGINVIDKSSRTNMQTWVNHDATEQTMKIVDRIAKLVNIPATHAEKIQFAHYDCEQFYNPHYDGWMVSENPEERDEQQKIKKATCMDGQGGQRLTTALVYLNSVEEGGATYFPKLDKSIYPEPGKVLIFWNVYEGTNTIHPDSLHGAQPVKKGEKWIFNLWFRAEDIRSIDI